MGCINPVLFLLLLCFSFTIKSTAPQLESDWFDQVWQTEEDYGTGAEREIAYFADSKENVIMVSVPTMDLYGNPMNNQNIDDTLENNIPQKPSETPNLFTIDVLAEKVNNLSSKVSSQESKISKLEASYKSLEEKIDLIEQQTKTNNVIFFNIKEDKHESHKTTLQKILAILNRLMKVRVNVRDISVALRAEGNVTQNRPVVVRFTNFDTKMKVLAVRNRLTRSKIIVVGDYSEKVAKKRVALQPYLQSARSQGYQAFILYDKLVINGVKKSLEELQAEDFGKEEQTEGTLEQKVDSSEEDPKEQIEEVEVPPEDRDYDFE